MGAKTTVSVIKADVGSAPGHTKVPQELLDVCSAILNDGEKNGLLIDFYVTRCGDDIELIMTHDNGVNAEPIHALAWHAFEEAATIAGKRKYYGAGQDLLSNSFSGNVKGMGPGCAEFEIEERKSEPIIIFMMDKTEPASFNLPFYRMFADPFGTAGLVLDPKLHDGFVFRVLDVYTDKTIELKAPEELYDLLAIIGVKSKFCIESVAKRSGEPAGVVATSKLNMIAGKYVGKDDPAAIVRCQSGFPAVGEVLDAFAFPYLVSGWMRGSHRGPLMPVSLKNANPTRFDGPPRVVALGFQLNDGMLEEPCDMFADPSFDRVREKANEIADYIRRHGPFQPHLLDEKDLEYTTLPNVLERLEDRFK